MTSHRRFRLTLEKWEGFIAVWFPPPFESLGPDEFEGMRHYVYSGDPWDFFFFLWRGGTTYCPASLTVLEEDFDPIESLLAGIVWEVGMD